jgi:hypothetical protein
MHPGFLKRSRLEQFIQPVARGHHTFFAASFQFIRPAASTSCGTFRFQFFQE